MSHSNDTAHGTDPPDTAATRPYVAITGDAHAGASVEMYREYLDPEYREDFDAWRSAYRGTIGSHSATRLP